MQQQIRLPLDDETDLLVDQLVARGELKSDPPAALLEDDKTIGMRRLFGLTRKYLRTQDELAALAAQRAMVLSEYAAAEERLQRQAEAAMVGVEIMAPKHIPAKKKSVTIPGLATLQFKAAGGTWVFDDDTVIAGLPADVKPELAPAVPKLDRAAFRRWADAREAEKQPVPAHRAGTYDSFSISDKRRGDEPEEPPLPEYAPPSLEEPPVDAFERFDRQDTYEDGTPRQTVVAGADIPL